MRKLFLVALVAATFCVTVVGGALGVSGSDTITNIAGSGTAGATGDGGQATSAQLNVSAWAAVDAQGNVYVTDSGNNKLRKVSGGTITTFAGTGAAGSAGDGGQATSAQLSALRGVAVDGQGNVYIGDSGNNKIRKVSGGTITTFAGTGAAGATGDGGQATSAQLNFPRGVAVDGQGNVYIADSSNNKIRKVSGGNISTFAGTGTAGAAGDGGPATSAQLNFPSGVAVDGQGNVYIADQSNNKVRKVSGGNISTFAGTGAAGAAGDGGQATAAQLNQPNRGGGGRGGQRLHRRLEQQQDPEGERWHDHDRRGHRHRRVRRRWWACRVGPAQEPAGSRCGRAGERLRLRHFEPAGAEDHEWPADGVVHGDPVERDGAVDGDVDGSGSSDPGGSITTFAWDFGDSGTASGATASHQYMAAGSFTVKLTVTDDSGATASASQTVTVSAAAAPPPLPRAEAEGEVRRQGRDDRRDGAEEHDHGHAACGRDRGPGGERHDQRAGRQRLICGGPGKDTIKGGPGKRPADRRRRQGRPGRRPGPRRLHR